MSQLSKPTAITAEYETVGFSSGELMLDEWLQQRALINDQTGASRTFVVCEQQKIVAYYSLAAGSISHQAVSASVKRNMPNPIPAIVLGRLAVDQSLQGKGVGVGLLQDAVLRAKAASEYIGARVLLVHALSDSARQFYLRFGFQISKIDEMTLFIRLGKL